MIDSFEIKSAALTGATGAIGRALINELLKNGIRVLVFARESERARELERLGITVVYTDLSELENIHLSEQYDAFFHLGWNGTRGEDRLNEQLQKKNVEYTLSAVRLAKRLGCKSFVGVGSQAEYGRVESGVKLSPETETNPDTFYGSEKLNAMQEARKLCGELGIKFCWCRVLSTYGIGDNPNNLIMYLINQCISGGECNLTPCEHKWDYLFTEDLARGLLLISKRGVNGEIYVIGSGTARDMKEYVNAVYDAVGNKDAKLNFGAIDYYPNQVMYLCADISKLVIDTGFAPEIPFEEGIKKTVDYYKGKHDDE